MVDQHEKHVELMTNHLADLGIMLKNVSPVTKDIVLKTVASKSTAGKMFEDDWED